MESIVGNTGRGTLSRLGLRGTIVIDEDRNSELCLSIAALAFFDTIIQNTRGRASLTYRIAADPNDEDRDNLAIRNNPATSRIYAEWLLDAPKTMFKDLFRMLKAAFRGLCKWLRIYTIVAATRYQSLEQKVIVFLWICTYNEPQRNTAFRFKIS